MKKGIKLLPYKIDTRQQKTKAGKVQTGRKRPRAHFSRCLPHFLMWPPFFKMADAFSNVAAIFQDCQRIFQCGRHFSRWLAHFSMWPPFFKMAPVFLRPMLRRCLCYRSKGEQGGGAGQVMVSACLFS